ncbi:uncharacterized protein SPPG_00838 [Spizellomyces punctatus DAOM BR117]|uniref:Uncharacterized protein n=1 Tax=Spizellomyces punctatus (strain DAOM BR117) TaxID=645134 RepID=A0A0L0HV01_SPIPD|nr:uncharacterized protein SPPG_00838 [Spizellomyces punctatus DAOM BR117]KND05171.1 hypothetical protein SPPG_00838 [Spizellomyces punctatus DAOM BR117]|eukprot:XP_016613210.1 hypothetical protein SPPG_00838 [Spizellomyces punctatus DAOM BR117]
MSKETLAKLKGQEAELDSLTERELGRIPRGSPAAALHSAFDKYTEALSIADHEDPRTIPGHVPADHSTHPGDPALSTRIAEEIAQIEDPKAKEYLEASKEAYDEVMKSMRGTDDSVAWEADTAEGDDVDISKANRSRSRG